MGFKTKTYTDDYLGRDFTEWTCDVCGWTTQTEAGADVCCCPECEAKYNEGGPCDTCPNDNDDNAKCQDDPERCALFMAWHNRK